jgi:hypothetical protein
MIAQVNEQQMAMVALAMDPARQANGLANIAGAQSSAIMGTVGVHEDQGSLGENCGEKRAPRFNAGKAFVNPR